MTLDPSVASSVQKVDLVMIEPIREPRQVELQVERLIRTYYCSAETNEGMEQHEATSPGDVGDEGLSLVGGDEPVFNKQPKATTPNEMAECDEGPNTSQGEKPRVDEMPKQRVGVVLEVAKGTGDEGLDTIRGEAPEESGGMGFEVSLSEAAIVMVVVSLKATPVAATSAAIPSAEETARQ
ncbi:hypothetical protein AMTR_s00031p00142830 [Amborella trichopoda]|uniref:Uncharacterized protein n=1 Tax=Amborella trichopoda TaxID=13333 RepID=U5D2B4_AMBTC|nr:hypothetical protein AMTR_s00031p00142830 [Amborella trichopoda]